MSTKHLGKQFDIHGGGMDLIPTHHTNEVAQSGLQPDHTGALLAAYQYAHGERTENEQEPG